MIDQLKKQLGTSNLSGKRITALLIFGAIILVFVLFGYQGKHTAMGVGSAARVNASLISVSELRAEAAQVQQMYGQLFAGQMSGDAQRQFVNGQAIENLISREVLSQSAKEQGILCTDAEIRDYVANDMQAFQRDGRFDKEIYVRLLEANHLTPSEFEDKIRKERKILRARMLFEDVASIADAELAKQKLLKSTKVNIAFAKVDEDKILAGSHFSEAEINKNLADAEFMKKVETEFNTNKSQYGSEEKVRASHILIKFKNDDEASQKDALNKITNIRERATKEDFGKLAAELSEDQGSKVHNGDLGVFGHGKMVPEFEQAAFSQKAGELGEPVKTSYGYHLIKVAEHIPAVTPALDSLKSKIAQKLMGQEKLQAAIKDLETSLAASDSSAVDQKLKALGVNWDETGLIDMTTEFVPKIGSRFVSQVIFDVSSQKPLLPRLINDGTSHYVLRFKSAKKEDLSEADSKALAQSGKERAYDLFGKWVEDNKKLATIERNPLAIRGE